MIDNRRLGLMIRLAKEDQARIRRRRKIAGYYRNDYIALSLIRQFILMTIAYVMLVGVIAVFSLDFISNNISRFDFRVLAGELIIGYLIFMGIYMGVTYIISSVTYHRAKKERKEYEEQLKKLERLYMIEERRMGMTTAWKDDQ